MNVNKNVKKAGIGLMTLLLGAGVLGGGYYLSQNQAAAENQVETITEADVSEQIAEKQAQFESAVVGIDIFEKINTALENKEILDQQKLDELTYIMYQYAQSNYQFIGADDSVATADIGFEKLLELYQQSSVAPSFSYDAETGNVTVLRDLAKPDYYDKNVKELSEKAEEAAKEVVIGDSDSSGVSADLEVEVVE